MVELSNKWCLVRGANIPRHLRHLLLVVMHYQGGNESAWCKRETLANELGITRDVVSQQMKELESIGVVVRIWKSRHGRPSREYSIQFSELAKHQRSLSDSSECASASLRHSSTSVLGIPQRQSEASLRDEVTSEEPVEQPSSRPNRYADSDMETAVFIWKLIEDMQPGRKPPNLNKWADTIRLMREQDKRTDEQIRDLFAWCNQDSFWRTNILSPDKLRQKWDDLQLKRGHGTKTTEPDDDCEMVFRTIRDKYHPDIRNASDVESVLTPEQFAAANSVGLRRIANADKYDKTTAKEYRTARKGIA